MNYLNFDANRSYFNEKSQEIVDEIIINARSIIGASRIVCESNKAMIDLAAFVACFAVTVFCPVVGIPLYTLATAVAGLGLLFFEIRFLYSFMPAYSKAKNELIAQYYNIERLHDDKKVALILTAKADYSGALHATPLNELKKTYSIAAQQVASITDIQKAIEDTVLKGNTIQLLWIQAHGSSTSMNLGGYQIPEDFSSYPLSKMESVLQAYYQSKISFKNVSQLEPYLDKLDPQASIVLDSCSTGSSLEHPDNIANAISVRAQGRMVWAATDVQFLALIKGISPFDVRFYDLCWGNCHNQHNLIERIKRFACAIFLVFSFKSSFFLRDVTTTYYSPAVHPPVSRVQQVSSQVSQVWNYVSAKLYPNHLKSWPKDGFKAPKINDRK